MKIFNIMTEVRMDFCTDPVHELTKLWAERRDSRAGSDP